MASQNPKRIGFAGLVDSPHRCPFDGKRLIVESATKADGEETNRHECWDCGYTFLETPAFNPETVRTEFNG